MGMFFEKPDISGCDYGVTQKFSEFHVLKK